MVIRAGKAAPTSTSSTFFFLKHIHLLKSSIMILSQLQIPGVNLPPLILIHSTFLILYGLKCIFTRPTKQSTAAEAVAMAGITTLGIGLAYTATAYMPISENQFLHASVPVRMGLAITAGLRLLLMKDVMSTDGVNQMLFVLLYDGLGGALCGYELGNFSGRIPT
jgi:hypothetical protein